MASVAKQAGDDTSGRQAPLAPAKTRVAVLGCGLGAMGALYKMSASNLFDIDVYQMGWRPGGKATSGHASAEYGKRVEEHGLHLMFGFYDTTLQMLKDVWGDDFSNYFQPHDVLTLYETVEGGQLIPWTIRLPRNDLEPGTQSASPGWRETLNVGIAILKQILHPLPDPTAPAPASVANSLPEPIRNIINMLRGALLKVLSFLNTVLKGGALVAVGLLAQLLQKVNDWIIQPIFKSGILDDVIDFLWNEVTFFRRAYTIVEFGFVVGLELVKALGKVNNHDHWEQYDDQDFHEFLLSKGMNERVVYSVIPYLPYLGAYVFEPGNGQPTRFAAGTAIMTILNMLFKYKGAVSYRMVTGMGDVIPAKMYTLLRDRGVRFHFFHKVTNLGLNDAKTAVGSVTMKVQADLLDSAVPYEPTFQLTVPRPPSFSPGGDVTLDVFPMEPQWAQLNKDQADELQAEGVDLEDPWSSAAWEAGRGDVTITAGDDFDAVVLNISVAGVKEVTPELQAASATWKTMCEGVRTVSTTGIQLWFNKTAEEMGWTPPTAGDPYTITNAAFGVGLRNPFNTLGDYTHDTLAFEEWAGTSLPEEKQPKNCTYITGPWPTLTPDNYDYSDSSFPARERTRCRGALEQWIRNSLAAVYPGLRNADDSYNWDWLVDVSDGTATPTTGTARLDDQWLRVNLAPSERYVIPATGTTRLRMAEGQVREFDNLYICGDWTYSDIAINSGYADHAVLSGVTVANQLMVPYAQYGNAPPFTLPYSAPTGKTTFFAFKIKNVSGIQTVLNSLSTGGVSLVLAAPLMLFGFAGFVDMQSKYHTPAVVNERDIQTFIPVAAMKDGGGGGLQGLQGLYMLPLYLFVNDPWACINGREHFGFDKAVAECIYPEAFGPGEEYKCVGKVIPTKGEAGETRTILQVTVSDDEPSEPSLVWEGQAGMKADKAALEQRLYTILSQLDFAALAQALAAMGLGAAVTALNIAGADFISKVATWLLNQFAFGVPMGFAKMFPTADTTDLSTGCYRTLTTSVMTVSDLKLQFNFTPFTITFGDGEEEPFWPKVAADCGLDVTQEGFLNLSIQLDGVYEFGFGHVFAQDTAAPPLVVAVPPTAAAAAAAAAAGAGGEESKAE